MRAVERFFRDRGIDRQPVSAATREFVHEVRDVIEAYRDRFPAVPPVPGACESPWVSYTAPYGGYSWAFHWTRSPNAAVPDLQRYLDASTGHIGSRIEVRVDNADDDDHLTAEYHTGLNVWHVPLRSGPLEVYVAFEFNRSPYSGRVRDEFGVSSATYTHWAAARLRASDTVGRLEVQDSSIFNLIDVAWGSDDDWEREVARQRDMHWYHFKTVSTFDQGTPVLLEGGVWHMAWFRTNDESVRLTSDMDLRLNRIMVRSCNADVIL